MFLLKLTGLVFACAAIGGVILCLIAKLKKKDPWTYTLGKNAENRWAKIFVLELAIIFMLACFNFGPAVLLPEKLPTPEQRGGVDNFVDHLLHGKNAPAKKIPTEPLPWIQGSWFWWGAFFILVPVCFVFLCWAYSDDVIHYAERRREEKIKQKEAEETEGKHKHGEKHGHAKGEEDKRHFWKPDFWDIISIGEMVARFAKDWKRK